MKRIIVSILAVVGLTAVVVYATRAPIKDQGGTDATKQAVVQKAIGAMSVTQKGDAVAEKDQAATTKGHYTADTHTAIHAPTATTPTATPITTTATSTSGTQKQTATVTTGAYQDQTATATKVVVANGKVNRAGTAAGVGTGHGQDTDVNTPLKTEITAVGAGTTASHVDVATTHSTYTGTTLQTPTAITGADSSAVQPTVAKISPTHSEGGVQQIAAATK